METTAVKIIDAKEVIETTKVTTTIFTEDKKSIKAKIDFCTIEITNAQNLIDIKKAQKAALQEKLALFTK